MSETISRSCEEFQVHWGLSTIALTCQGGGSKVWKENWNFKLRVRRIRKIANPTKTLFWFSYFFLRGWYNELSQTRQIFSVTLCTFTFFSISSFLHEPSIVLVIEYSRNNKKKYLPLLYSRVLTLTLLKFEIEERGEKIKRKVKNTFSYYIIYFQNFPVSFFLYSNIQSVITQRALSNAPHLISYKVWCSGRGSLI